MVVILLPGVAKAADISVDKLADLLREIGTPGNITLTGPITIDDGGVPARATIVSSVILLGEPLTTQMTGINSAINNHGTIRCSVILSNSNVGYFLYINGGTIVGDMTLNGSGMLTNSGTITGNVTRNDTGNIFNGVTGTISGDVTINGSGTVTN